VAVARARLAVRGRAPRKRAEELAPRRSVTSYWMTLESFPDGVRFNLVTRVSRISSSVQRASCMKVLPKSCVNLCSTRSS
jgi:hypothetical protein